jgi:hypothetical protein
MYRTSVTEIQVFFDITLCRMINNYRRSERAYCLLQAQVFQGEYFERYSPKLKIIFPFQMSVTLYHILHFSRYLWTWIFYFYLPSKVYHFIPQNKGELSTCRRLHEFWELSLLEYCSEVTTKSFCGICRDGLTQTTWFSVNCAGILIYMSSSPVYVQAMCVPDLLAKRYT